MKKIEYSFIHKDKYVSVRITKQTHRDNDFGINKNEFDCQNGITMASVSCPANDINCDYIFFRGDCSHQDNKIIVFNANEFELFKECVEEYNEWFSKK